MYDFRAPLPHSPLEIFTKMAATARQERPAVLESIVETEGGSAVKGLGWVLPPFCNSWIRLII